MTSPVDGRVLFERARLAHEWLDEVRRLGGAHGVADEELLDNFPAFLEALERAAAEADGGAAHIRLMRLLEDHLVSRMRHGFPLCDVIEEYALLGRKLQAHWDSRLPEPDSATTRRVFDLLHRCTEEVIRAYVGSDVEEVQAQRRCAFRLDELVTRSVALPDGSVHGCLPELASVVREGVGSDVALLYVRDPANPILHPFAGQGSGVEAALPDVATDSDALPAVAARAGGLLHQERDALAAHDPLRTLDVADWSAVSLTRRGVLLGAVCVGWREPRPLALNARHRLELFAERIAILVHLDRLLAAAERRQTELVQERAVQQQLVALIAHDLRSPLMVARVAVERMMDPDRPEPAPQLLPAVVRSLDRVDRMLGDLLDTMRLRAGQPLRVFTEPVDLAELTRDLVQREIGMVHPRRVQAEIPDEPIRGTWSADQLRRAIWNLVSNALKHGKPGGPVKLRVVAQPDAALIEVHNENAGEPLAPEQQALAFTPFSRLSNATRGWGLGLTLVRACAEAHGGSVHVTSTAAEGTTFTLRLPRSPG